ncbi:hypothetical protein POI8812_02102 [Pontivivens insulae]|uniref:PAS domain-containing protein n=2 Tax=Pontivivens insulae TaxID=1639689 RepID=A0A2R8ACH2_9RHOB|nr:PAS domain-containing protein [Pontivivens insulae]SPF29785.1 hypothetical protein POI8812_02102 [Pontivivens insulae]
MEAESGERRDRIASTLAAYWERLRGERVAPRRSELDPSQFTSALEHMFILEDVAHGPVRFRLTGSAVARTMGMELRSMPMRAIFAPEDTSRLDDILRDALDHPASIDLVVEGAIGQGTLILRPLTDDFGSFTRLLGCIVFDTDGPMRSGNLRIKSVRFQPLTENKRASAAMGLSEDQAPFTPAPHLRVVKTSGTGGGNSERKPPALRIVRTDD